MTISGSEGRRAPPIAEVRAILSASLRGRLPEIEKEIFARVRAVSPADVELDPAYVEGLRMSVNDAIAYVIDGIEEGREPEPIPRAVRLQARRAAHVGLPLDTILRRYATGDRLITEFIMDEAESLPWPALQQILRGHGAHIDHLMAMTSTEYMREAERVRRSPTQRLGERVRKLLAGEAAPAHELNYDFSAWHVGLLATGRGAEHAVASLGRVLQLDTLVVPADDESETVWAWFGGRRAPSLEGIVDAWPNGGLGIALGEPRRGLDGWRQTHREAQAAYQVLSRGSLELVRSRDVLLAAAVLQDETLATALTETYLDPLDGRGDSGAVLRKTLRAYFSAGQNAATAAAALSVNRHTVERRIRNVEEKVGQLLGECRAQLEVALAIEQLADGRSRPKSAEPGA
jgi:hypothetical protein